MRILFDQATPVPLRRYLTGHSVRTAAQEQWATLQNGELIALAEAAGFDVLQDRSVSRPRGVRDPAAASAQPDAGVCWRHRVDALHASAADARSARARGHAGVRARNASPRARDGGHARHVAFRDRAMGREGSDTQPHGPQGRQGPHDRARQDDCLPEQQQEAHSDSHRSVPVVRQPAAAGVVQPAPNRGRTDRPQDRLPRKDLRVPGQQPAPHRGRGRADLPPRAVLRHRHGRQVREPAVGRRQRRASRRSRSVRQGGLLRSLAAQCRRQAAHAAGATGSDHSGRAAPDLGTPGNDGGPVRDGH